MKSSKARYVGWGLSILLAAFLILASASGKFTDWPGKAEMFAEMGWDEDVMFRIGIVEVVIAVMFLIPRAAFIAAILLSAYLGGAVATHVRVNEAFFIPIIMGVLVWIALGLRDRRIFELAFAPYPSHENESPSQDETDN